jgi:hypothetical protein
MIDFRYILIIIFYIIYLHICRKVLEQACVQTLPVRKMRTLFKKFMSFEEKCGTPEAVERVRQMATDYVEKQCNMDKI